VSIVERVVAHREAILALAAKRGARNVRVFGSVARGEADERSDLDILVTMDAGRTLFDLGGLVYDLMELLGCQVDVVTEGALQGRFKERVLQDATPLPGPLSAPEATRWG
jgi:predicted nucleotidyltransferase